MSCYNKDKSNTGVDHKMPEGRHEGLRHRLRQGRPAAGLADADGKVYQISGGLAAEKNAKLIAHISHTVSITGDVMDHGGGKMMISADSLKMISWALARKLGRRA